MNRSDGKIYAEGSVITMLFKIAPPIMFAQLIQSLYNLVDSIFIGKSSEAGLTALAVMNPVQLLILAIGVGTGTGVNIVMSYYFGQDEKDSAYKTAGTGTILGIACWILFSLAAFLFLRPYTIASAGSEEAIRYACTYGYIICFGSLPILLTCIWNKILQAAGDVRTPMVAGIAGAVINMILDPLLIFGTVWTPGFGIAGAAIASVIGQIGAAFIVGRKAIFPAPKLREGLQYIKRIYQLGYPTIIMQSLWTIYISILNMILAGFCDEAITVLGLYYKLQSFFFIPFLALLECVVPALSYNYAAHNYARLKSTFVQANLFSMGLMLFGVIGFEFFPVPLISIFSNSDTVKEIGQWGFRIIGLSFIPAVPSWMFPVFFQSIGRSMLSSFLSVFRQLMLLTPIFWLLSKFGLNYCWFAFVITELIVTAVSFILYQKQTAKWH